MLPGVPGCYLDFTWTPPGHVAECKVLIKLNVIELNALYLDGGICNCRGVTPFLAVYLALRGAGASRRTGQGSPWTCEDVSVHLFGQLCCTR